MKTTLILLLPLLTLLAACERDFSATPTQTDISFSADTISFDTIYAGNPSTTIRFTIRNNSDNDVTISSISLQGDNNSPFAINIAGQPSTSVSNIHLAHSDSLFLFAYVRNPNPANGNALTSLTDHVIAQAGTNTWSTTLHATVLNVSRQAGTLSSDTQWLCDTIPYLISDTLAVNANLTIGPSVTVLFQNNASLQIHGSLVIAADPDHRASLMPMRQDGFYQDIPGQWAGIDILPSAHASLAYVNIACPTHGISVDSAASLSANALYLRDISHTAISARHANISLRNTLITNSGGPSIALTGGITELTHVTIANYFSWDTRHTEALLITPSDTSHSSLRVLNSIIMGSHNPEVEPDSLAGNALFSGSLIRADKNTLNSPHFQDCLTSSNAHFANRDAANYHLSTSSDAVGLALPQGASIAPTDFEGLSRFSADTIQAGAFQTISF